MANGAFFSQHKSAGPRQPEPGELVWEAHVRGRFYRCELRDHGRWGVEAQVFLDNDFFYGERFASRETALAAAKRDKDRLEQGWCE
jgi:hypothetical protein